MTEWQQIDGEWRYGDRKLTATKAIKQYCKNHCNGPECDNRSCELYLYREGHNPARKGIGRVRAQKAKNGTYKPSQDGFKRGYIKGMRRGDEIIIKASDIPDGVKVIIEK